MKRLRRLVWIVMVICVVSSSPGGPTVTNAQEKPTIIRFLWYAEGSDRSVIESIVRRFNEANPDTRVHLSLVPFDHLDQLLLTQASADQAPDLARVREPYRFFRYALDIRPHLKSSTFAKDFLDGPVRAVTGKQGQLYGIPLDLTLTAPFVNMTLFKRAGTTPPSGKQVSWAEVVGAANKVKKATGIPYAAAFDWSGDQIDGYVQAYGGGFFNPDGTPRILSRETQTGIEAFVGHYRDDAVVRNAQGIPEGVAQYFVEGKLALYVSGSWQVAQFHKHIADRFEWTSLPNGFNGHIGGMPGGSFLMAMKTTKAPAKAVRFLEFLTSAATMTEYARSTMIIPTRNDLLATGLQYRARNDELNAFGRAIGSLPAAAYIDRYNSTFHAVARIVRDHIAQVISGDMELRKALESAQAKSLELQTQALKP